TSACDSPHSGLEPPQAADIGLLSSLAPRIALAVLVCLAGPPWGAFRRRRRRHGLHNRRICRLSRSIDRSGRLNRSIDRSGGLSRDLRSLPSLLSGPQRIEDLDEGARGGVE